MCWNSVHRAPLEIRVCSHTHLLVKSWECEGSGVPARPLPPRSALPQPRPHPPPPRASCNRPYSDPLSPDPRWLGRVSAETLLHPPPKPPGSRRPAQPCPLTPSPPATVPVLGRGPGAPSTAPGRRGRGIGLPCPRWTRGSQCCAPNQARLHRLGPRFGWCKQGPPRRLCFSQTVPSILVKGWLACPPLCQLARSLSLCCSLRGEMTTISSVVCVVCFINQVER